jgi:hypothetical protein
MTIPKLAIDVNMTGAIHGNPNGKKKSVCLGRGIVWGHHTSLKAHPEANESHRSKD